MTTQTMSPAAAPDRRLPLVDPPGSPTSPPSAAAPRAEPAQPFPASGLYRPPRSPVMVDVPVMVYLRIDGTGRPWQTLAWAHAVDALQAVSAAVAALLGTPSQPPLEALIEDGDVPSWTLLLAQPDAATADVVARAVAAVAELEGMAGVSGAHGVRRERRHEGWSAQVLQVGPAGGSRAAALLGAFIDRYGYLPRGPQHKIYLDDPLSAPAEFARTVLRQPVSRPD